VSGRRPEFPGLLGRLAEEVGEDAARALAEHFGGREIYIPREVRGGHPLARALGIETARAVAAALGPGDVTVPLGPAGDHRDARARIEALLAEGLGNREIQAELNCHIKTVRRVRRAARRAGRLPEPRGRCPEDAGPATLAPSRRKARIGTPRRKARIGTPRRKARIRTAEQERRMVPVSQHDIHMMASTIVAEARGEPWIGKVAVGWVIRNRHANPGWWSRERDTVPDDTIAAVCVDAWQFSGLNSCDPNLRYAMIMPPDHPEYLECLAAALAVILDKEQDPTEGAGHYHARSMRQPPAWAAGLRPCFETPGHLFFNDVR
jgi:hypothetical protein